MSRNLTRVVADIAASLVSQHQLALSPTADGLIRDEEFLEALLGGDIPSGFLRIWRQEHCIAVPRSFVRRPGFAQVASRSSALGWPVRERISGGSAVAQHPGILNFSLFLLDEKDAGRLDRGFLALGALLRTTVARIGLDTDLGSVSRASCDGSQNLRCSGRKLAGMAAASRTRRGRRGVLVHANLIVEANLRDDLEALCRVEQGLGMKSDYDVAAHAGLATLCAGILPRRPHAPA